MTESPIRSDDREPCEPFTLEACYREYAPGLRAALKSRLANDLDVDDCLNRVFEKFWQRGREVPPAARRAWLFVVARNEAALLCRKSRRGSLGAVQPADGFADLAECFDLDRHSADESNSPLQRLLTEEQLQRLDEARARLPEDQAAVIRCRFFEDLSFREIAERLGIPLGTALTRARAAIKRLGDEIEG